MGGTALARFDPVTREWFTGAFAEPTAAQEGAWTSIARGDNTLVVAPTGSGKTLAAFLWSLDRLAAEQMSPPSRNLIEGTALGMGLDRQDPGSGQPGKREAKSGR